MSSCLTGGGGFDLDIVVISPSPSSRSSPSSTLSEASNSPPLFISTKRARAPRKRPNQCSAEAAALLSTIYPKLFSSTNLRRPTRHRHHHHLLHDPFPVLLPTFPVLADASLLLNELPSFDNSAVRPDERTVNWRLSSDTPCSSQVEVEFMDPGSPDFYAESILDEEVEEGMDSIVGNLSIDPNHSNPNLMGFGLSGFGFGISSSMIGALRQSDDGEWWRHPSVTMKDIAPKFKPSPANEEVSAKKKRKRKKETKVEKEEAKEAEASPNSAALFKERYLKNPLSLKLDYDGVIKEWFGGSPFSGETGSPEFAAADEVGRFDKRTLLLQQAMQEESQ